MPNARKLQYTKEQLGAAIQAFNEGCAGRPSRREVARAFGVPETTLRTHTGTAKLEQARLLKQATIPRKKKTHRTESNLLQSKQTVDFKLPYSVIDNIRKLPAGEKHQFSGTDNDGDGLHVFGCHLNADFFSLTVTGAKKEGDLIKCHIRDVDSSSLHVPSTESCTSPTQSVPEAHMLKECKQESAAPDTPPLAVVPSGSVTSPEPLEPTASKEENSIVKITRRAVNTRRSVKRQAGSSAEDESPNKSKKSRNSNDTKEKTRGTSKSRLKRVHTIEEQVENAEDTSVEHNESSGQLSIELDDNASKTDRISRKRSQVAEWVRANPLFEFSCKMCSFQIRSRERFLKHLRSHDKTSRAYITDFNVDHLDLTTVREQKRIQCLMCEDSYLDLGNLVKHTNTIHKTDPRRKDQLNVVTELRWSQVTTGILQDCSYCGKTYSGRRIMSHLKLIHSKEPDFVEKLRLHAITLDRISRKQSSYKRKARRGPSLAATMESVICPYCAKQMHPHYLSQHMKNYCKEMVTAKRLYKCPCCEFRSYEMTEWQKHKATEHKRLMVCEVCGKSLGSKSAMAHHIRFKHGIFHRKPLTYKTCHVCSKSFETKSSLDRHMPTHSDYREKTESKCSICGRVCRDKGGLHNHMRVHRNKFPLRCSKCGHGVYNRQKLEAHRCGHVRRKDKTIMQSMDEDKQVEEPSEVTEDCCSNEVALKAETATAELTETVYIQQVQSGNETTVKLGDVEYGSYIILGDGSLAQTEVIKLEGIDQSEYNVITAAADVEVVDG